MSMCLGLSTCSQIIYQIDHTLKKILPPQKKISVVLLRIGLCGLFPNTLACQFIWSLISSYFRQPYHQCFMGSASMIGLEDTINRKKNQPLPLRIFLSLSSTMSSKPWMQGLHYQLGIDTSHLLILYIFPVIDLCSSLQLLQKKLLCYEVIAMLTCRYKDIFRIE